MKEAEKISKYYNEIKQLDNDVLRLEKLGERMKDDKIKISVDLGFNNLEKENSNIEEPHDFEQNILRSIFEPRTFYAYGNHSESNQNKETISLKNNSYESFLIVGFMLELKNRKRKTLVNKIKEIASGISKL